MHHLTSDDAETIRLFRANGTSMRALRRLPLLWGEPVVSLTAIKSVVYGRTFPDAGGPVGQRPPRRKPPVCGTPSCYSKGCRCPLCTQANIERCRQWRTANPQKVHAERRK